MKVNIEDKEVAEFYEEFPDAIFVPFEDFKKFIGDLLPEPMIPPFVVAGEAVLLSFRHLKMITKSFDIHFQKYKLTSDEGGFWIAKLEKPPKGDIMNRSKRLGGSFGSKQ